MAYALYMPVCRSVITGLAAFLRADEGENDGAESRDAIKRRAHSKHRMMRNRAPSLARESRCFRVYEFPSLARKRDALL